MKFGGLALNAKGAAAWTGAALLFLVGAAAFELARRRFRVRWDEAQGDIERETRRRETA
jgi:branched-chain amino acid transport system permease protein